MFTYNGQELSAGVKVLDIKRPILAPQSLSTLHIEGKHGSFFYKKTSDSLTIEIDLMIKGSTVAELRNNIREFAEFIDADEPKPLVFHDEQDKYINAVISGDSSLENLFRLGSGTITMFAPDPFYYATEDDVFEYVSTGIKNFTRRGNAISYPVIEISGVSGAENGFTLITDTSSIAYTGELLQGERLVLDSELLTAYIIKTSGERVSAIPYLDKLDFPVLARGANSINVVPSGSTINSYKVTCNSRWK